MPTIRKATEGDIADVMRLARSFLATSGYGKLMPSVPADQLLQLCRTVMALGVIFLAELGEDDPAWQQGAGPHFRIVGMIAVCDLEHPLTGQQYADEIAWFVEPAHRSGSIGPRLLAQVEVWAREKQLHMVKMVAPAGSDVGRFYERLGYRAVETAYQKEIA